MNRALQNVQDFRPLRMFCNDDSDPYADFGDDDSSGTGATTPPLATSGGGCTTGVMDALNEFGADTIGVLWRAGGGVDPFTQNELEDAATCGQTNAGGTAAQISGAANQSDLDTANAVAAAAKIPASQLLAPNGLGCNTFTGFIADPMTCMPTWVWWVGGAILGLWALSILSPYLELAESN